MSILEDLIEPLKGFATQKGTEKFLRSHEGRHVSRGHFLGHVELWLSSMGIGTFLGNVTPAVDNLIKSAIMRSIESGAVNIIDTAINYRLQRSEKVIGETLRLMTNLGQITREQVFIVTKQGYLPGDAELRQTPEQYLKNLIKAGMIKEEEVKQGHCLNISFLKSQIEQSLQNLQVETIDLLLLHNSSEIWRPHLKKKAFLERLHEIFTFYEEMRSQGKIRFYGLASWDAFRVPPTHPAYLSLEEIHEIAANIKGEQHGFRFIEIPFSIFMPEALIHRWQMLDGKAVLTLEVANQLGIGVLGNSPLQQGAVIGKLGELRIPKLHTDAQKALQFVRSTPGVIPIVGMKQPQHVEENLMVARVKILDEKKYLKCYFKKK